MYKYFTSSKFLRDYRYNNQKEIFSSKISICKLYKLIRKCIHAIVAFVGEREFARILVNDLEVDGLE